MSVTFVRPTQMVEILGNVSTPLDALAIYIHGNVYDRPRGSPPLSSIASVCKNKVTFVGLTVKSVELHQCAKFYRNRSNRGRDMVFLDFSEWRPPPSWIFEISNF